MNTWCGGALNSAYKIPPFLLPVGPGWCLSNEVTSCHVTPPPTPARPPLPLSNPPVWTFHLIPSTPRQPPTFPLLFLACVLWILRLLSVTNSPTQGYCLFSISAFVLPFQADYSLISLVGGEDGERRGGGAFQLKGFNSLLQFSSSFYNTQPATGLSPGKSGRGPVSGSISLNISLQH